jgi:transcriptional regulator with XRE-family HTH domain
MSNAALAKRLKGLRGEMPARQLAIKAGLSPSHVHAIESGRISMVGLGTAIRLAKALGVAVEKLIAE